MQAQPGVGSQENSMAVCDGALATPVANNVVSFPSSLRGAAPVPAAAAAPAAAASGHHQQQQQAEQQLYAVPDAPDSAPDAEEFSAPASPQQRGSRRRAFVASSGSRQAVTSQLTGLRRKAAIKAEVASVPA